MNYIVINNYKEIAAIILAGGQSSRMGTNKAFLKINDIYFVDKIIQVLNNSGIDNVFVSGNLPGYSCITDMFKNRGPMEGIRSSILYVMNLPYSYLLFLPIDVPLINKEIIQKLINNYFSFEANYFQNFPLPFLVKKDDCLHALKLNKNLNSIFSFLNLLNCNYSMPNEKEKFILKGVNTLTEWDFVKKYLKENLNEY